MLRLCEALVQYAVAGWCAMPPKGGNPGCQTPRWLGCRYDLKHEEARSPAAAFLSRECNIRARSLAGGVKGWPYEIDTRPLELEAVEL